MTSSLLHRSSSASSALGTLPVSGSSLVLSTQFHDFCDIESNMSTLQRQLSILEEDLSQLQLQTENKLSSTAASTTGTQAVFAKFSATIDDRSGVIAQNNSVAADMRINGESELDDRQAPLERSGSAWSYGSSYRSGMTGTSTEHDGETEDENGNPSFKRKRSPTDIPTQINMYPTSPLESDVTNSDGQQQAKRRKRLVRRNADDVFPDLGAHAVNNIVFGSPCADISNTYYGQASMANVIVAPTLSENDIKAQKELQEILSKFFNKPNQNDNGPAL